MQYKAYHSEWVSYIPKLTLLRRRNVWVLVFLSSKRASSDLVTKRNVPELVSRFQI